MFELYDIETNELVMTGTLVELGKFANRASSTVRTAWLRDSILAGKYKVECNGQHNYSACARYNVYDISEGKKLIISKKKAREIAEELFISISQVYHSSNHNKPICYGQYIVEFVGSGRGGRVH